MMSAAGAPLADESMPPGDAALPPGYAELAAKMKPAVRALVVENADPSSISADELLAGLGMPGLGPPPRAYPGLRSLALLNLLPKPAGSAADVLHVADSLSPSACAALRGAVDAASFSASDSVDGCCDYQLNLERAELEALVGEETVRCMWAMANRALRRLAPRAAGEEAPSSSSSEDEDEDDGDRDRDDDRDGGSRDEAGAAAEAAAEARAGVALEAHEIFVRRYTPTTRPWFPFHKDRSELTVNVALSEDAAHGGGRLIAIYDGAVRRVERREGEATVHPSSLMHAVSRMTHGARYSLIIFMGRNAKIVAFNREVRRMLGPNGPAAVVAVATPSNQGT